jgi:hypothetical protein
MIALGAAVSVQSLVSYKIGTLSQMGPGFFPLSIGILLVLLGIAIAVTAKPWIGSGSGMAGGTGAVDGVEAAPRPSVALEWRGWLCIALGILAFIVLGTHGGLVPATFAIVFISALGDRRNTWKSAGILALGTVVVAVVVFWWALKMPFPLFHW